MRLRLILTTAVLLAVLSGCGGNKIKLPIETSLGRLTSIEKKEAIVTDERTISAPAGKILYLLSFEGKNEIAYEGAQEDVVHVVSLVDGKGTEFTPVYSGSPTSGATLSNKEWRYNGKLKPKDGKFVFAGVLSVPAAKMVLAYEVPKDSPNLQLKNGERKHIID